MENKCTHNDWYNNEEGKYYCLKCNEYLGQLER